MKHHRAIGQFRQIAYKSIFTTWREGKGGCITVSVSVIQAALPNCRPADLRSALPTADQQHFGAAATIDCTFFDCNSAGG